MGIKEKLNKKPLKLLALLLTSMLIATVSATVYRYLYIDGSITVGTAKLIWIEGADFPDGSIDGSTATIDLNVEQGTPVNVTEALFLKNANTSGSFNLNITVTNNVSSTDFDEAKMHIYKNWTGPMDNWTYVDTLDLTDPNAFYYGSLAYGKYFRMTFEVNATITAIGQKPFDIQVEYWA